MQTSLLHSLLFVALAGGCAGSAHVGYTADVSTPEMVVISPGVQVIANYDEPIFYNDSYYWRNQGGVWYRSRSHSSGWVQYSAPRAILSIERPSAYVRYRGSVQVNDRHDHDRREEAKDRKDDRKDAAKERQEDRKDAAKERQEDRKEDRKDAAEKRKDQKEDKRDDKKRDDKKKHD